MFVVCCNSWLDVHSVTEGKGKLSRPLQIPSLSLASAKKWKSPVSSSPVHTSTSGTCDLSQWACAPCVGELALAHLMLSRYRPQVIPRLHPFHTLCKQWVASSANGPYLMRTSAIKHLPATLEQSPALLYVPHVCVLSLSVSTVASVCVNT